MEDEERQKKLQAGKERLAAFKKKKRRKRREGEDTASEASTMSETSSVASVIDMAEITAAAMQSDQGATSESESVQDESESEVPAASRPLLTARRELERAVQRITELEETLLGKQELVESLVAENDELRDKLEVIDKDKEEEAESEHYSAEPLTEEDMKNKMAKLQKLCTERDREVKELRGKLEAVSENRDSLQAEYTSQAEQLAQQVHMLQQQLKQAGDLLVSQRGEHGISGQALMEAKNELLALQQVNRQKEEQIHALQTAISERDEAINQMVERFNDSAHKFNTLQQANLSLQQETRSLKAAAAAGAAAHTRLQRDVHTLRGDLESRGTELAKARGEVGVLRQKYAEWQRMEDDLVLLRRKEKESGAVIKGLMADIENLQKGGILRMKLEGLESISVEQHKVEIEALKAELDELHGGQIVAMKQELVDSHRLEMDRAGRELKKIRSERDHLTNQVEDWQKMYVKLSQAGISDADLTLEIQALKNENAKYRMSIDELKLDLNSVQRELDWHKTQKENIPLKSSRTRTGSNSKELQQLEANYQHEKAEKERLTVRIQQLEADISQIKLQSTQELQGLQFKIDEMSREKESMSAAVSSHVTELEKQKQLHREEIEILQKQSNEMVRLNTEQLENELALTKEALRGLQSPVSPVPQSSSSHSALQDIQALSQAQTKQLEEIQSRHTSETSDLKLTIAELQNDLVEKSDRVVELETIVQDNKERYETDCQEFEKQISDLQDDLSEAKDKCAELKNKLQSALIDRDGVIDTYEAKLTETRSEISENYERKITMLNQEHKSVIEVMNVQVQKSQQQSRKSSVSSEEGVDNQKITALREERDFFKQQVEEFSQMLANQSTDDSKSSREEFTKLQEKVEAVVLEKELLQVENDNLEERLQRLSESIQQGSNPNPNPLLDELRTRANELSEENNALKDQVKKLKDSAGVTSQGEEIDDELKKAGATSQEELHLQRDELKKENETLKTYYQHASSENQTLRDHIQQINIQYNELGARYQTLRQKYQVDVAEMQGLDAGAQVEALRVRIQELEQRLGEERAVAEREKAEMEALRVRIQELEQRLSETSKENAATEPENTEIEALLVRIQELEQRLAETNNERMKEKEAAQQEKTHLEAEITNLRETTQNTQNIPHGIPESRVVVIRERIQERIRVMSEKYTTLLVTYNSLAETQGLPAVQPDPVYETEVSAGEDLMRMMMMTDDGAQNKVDQSADVSGAESADNVDQGSEEAGQSAAEVDQSSGESEVDQGADVVDAGATNIAQSSALDSSQEIDLSTVPGSVSYEQLSQENAALKSQLEIDAAKQGNLLQELETLRQENTQLRNQMTAMTAMETSLVGATAATSETSQARANQRAIEADILHLMKVLPDNIGKLDRSTTKIQGFESTAEKDAEVIEALKSFMGRDDGTESKTETMQETEKTDCLIQTMQETENKTESEIQGASDLMSAMQDLLGDEEITIEMGTSKGTVTSSVASNPASGSLEAAALAFIQGGKPKTKTDDPEITLQSRTESSEIKMERMVGGDAGLFGLFQQAREETRESEIVTCKTEHEFQEVVDTAAIAFTSIRNAVPSAVPGAVPGAVPKEDGVADESKINALEAEVMRWKQLYNEMLKNKDTTGAINCDTEDTEVASTAANTEITRSESSTAVESTAESVPKERIEELNHLCHALELDNERLKAEMQELVQRAESQPSTEIDQSTPEAHMSDAQYKELQTKYERIQSENTAYEEQLKTLMLMKDTQKSEHEAEVNALKRSQNDALRDLDSQFDVLNAEIDSLQERLNESLKKEQEAKAKAAEFDTLKENLIQVQQQLKQAKEKEEKAPAEDMEKIKEELKQKEGEVHKLTEEYKKAQGELTELQTEVTELQALNGKLQEEYETIKKEADVANENKESLVEDYAHLQAQIDVLESSKVALEQRVQEELQNLKESRDLVAKLEDSSSDQAQEALKRVKELETKVDELKEEAREQVVVLAQQEASHKKEIQGLESEREALVKSSEELKDQMAKDERMKLEEIAKLTDEITTEKNAAAQELTELKQSIEATMKEIEELKMLNTALKQEKQELVDKLSQTEESQQKAASETESELDKAKQQAEKLKEKLRESIKKQVETAKKLSEQEVVNQELKEKAQKMEATMVEVRESGVETTRALEEVKEMLESQTKQNEDLQKSKDALEEKMNSIRQGWEDELEEKVAELLKVQEILEEMKERANKSMEEQTESIEKKEAELKKAQEEIEELKTATAKSTQEHDELIQAKETELNQVREELEKVSDAMKQSEQSFGEKLQKAEEELESAQRQYQDATEKVQSLQQSLEEERALKEATDSQISEKLQAVSIEKETLQDQLRTISRKVEDSERDMQKLQDDMSKHNLEKENVERELNEKIHELSNEKQSVQESLQSAEDNLTRVTSEKSHLEDELEGLNQKLVENVEEQEKTQAELQKVSASLEDSKKALNDATAKQSSLEELNHQLEEQMEQITQKFEQEKQLKEEQLTKMTAELQNERDEKMTKTQAYETVAAECQALSKKYTELEENLRTVEEAAEKLRQESKKEASAKEALEADMVELQNALDDERKTLETVMAESSEKDREIQALKSEYSSKKVEIDNLQTSCTEVSQTLEALQTQLKESQQANEAKEKECETLRGELDVTRAEYEEALAKKEAELSHMETKVSRFKSENAILREDKEAVDSRVQHLDNECKTLQKTLSQMTGDSDQMKDSMKEMTSKIQELETELEKSVEQSKKIQEDLEKQMEQNKKSEETCRKMENELTMLKQEHTELQKEKSEDSVRIDSLLQEKESLENTITTTEENLASVKASSASDRSEFIAALETSQQELTTLKDTFEALKTEKATVDAEFTKLKEEHYQMVIQHTTEVQVVKDSSEETINALVLKSELSHKELVEKHSKEVENIRRNYDQTISEMAETLGSEKGTIVREYEQAMEMVREKQLLLEQIQEEIATLRVEKESQEMTFQRTETELTEAFKAEIEKLKAEATSEQTLTQEKLSLMEQQYQEKMAELDDEKQQRQQLQQNYDTLMQKSEQEKQELQALNDETCLKITQLEVSLQDAQTQKEEEIATVSETLERRLRDTEASHAMQVEELNIQINGMHEKLQKETVQATQAKQEVVGQKKRIEELMVQNQSLKTTIDMLSQTQQNPSQNAAQNIDQNTTQNQAQNSTENTTLVQNPIENTSQNPASAQNTDQNTTQNPDQNPTAERLAVVEAEKASIEAQYRSMVEMATGQIQQLVQERNDLYTKLQTAIVQISSLQGQGQGQGQSNQDIQSSQNNQGMPGGSDSNNGMADETDGNQGKPVRSDSNQEKPDGSNATSAIAAEKTDEAQEKAVNGVEMQVASSNQLVGTSPSNQPELVITGTQTSQPSLSSETQTTPEIQATTETQTDSQPEGRERSVSGDNLEAKVKGGLQQSDFEPLTRESTGLSVPSTEGRPRSVSADSLEVTERSRSRTLSADSLDDGSTVGGVAMKNARLEEVPEASPAPGEGGSEVGGLEEERSMLQASVDNLRASLTDMQHRRYELQEEVNLLQSKQAAMLEADGSEDILTRYEDEVSALKRSLLTVQDERDAMKDTFEEDLSRLHRQLLDMEKSRRRIERHLQAIKDKHPEVSDSFDESSTSETSPSSGSGFFLDSREASRDHSREPSVEVSPNRRPRPEVLAAMLETAGLAQGGLFSDSIQLETRLQNIAAMQGAGDTQSHVVSEQIQETQQTQSTHPTQSTSDTCQTQESGNQSTRQEAPHPMFGFASESVQWSPDDVSRVQAQASASEGQIQAQSQPVLNQTQPSEGEFEPVEATQAQGMNTQAQNQMQTQAEVQGSSNQNAPNPNTLTTPKTPNPNYPPPTTLSEALQRITDLETKLSRAEAQHATELAIQEFRLGERARAAAAGAEKARAQEDAEAERVRARDAEAAARQQQKSEDAERQRHFIQELQKVRQQLEESHQENLEKLRSRYEERELHQVSEGDAQYKLDQLVNKLATENEHLSTSHSVLLQQVDEFHHSQEAVQEQLQGLEEQHARLREENHALTAQLRSMENQQAEKAERRPSSGGRPSEGSFTVELSDLEQVEQENRLLRSQLEQATLGRQDADQEELMELQAKYDAVIKEKDVLVNRLRAMGSGAESGADRFTMETSGVVRDELHPLEREDGDKGEEEEEESGLVASSSLNEDFIDWKLKYETIEKQNQYLRQRLDSDVASPPPLKSPVVKTQSSFEFKSQYEALVEQNELLRAQLGAHGIFTERSMEGDVLDPRVRESYLQHENEAMVQRMQEFEASKSGDEEKFRRKIQTLKDELKKAQENIRELQRENDVLQRQLGESDGGETPSDLLATLQKENKDLIHRIVELEANPKRTDSRNEELEMKVEHLEASLESMASTIEASERVREENENLSQSLQGLREAIAVKDRKIKELTELNDKLSKAASTAEASAVIADENEKLRKRIEEIGEEITKANTLQTKCEALERECEKLRSTSVEFEKLQTTASESSSDWQKQNEELTKRIEQLVEEGKDKDEQLRQKEAEMEVEMQKLQNVESTSLKLEQDNEQLSKKIQELSEEIDTKEQTFNAKYEQLEAECNQLRSELQASMETPKLQDETNLREQFSLLQKENKKLHNDLSVYEQQIVTYGETEAKLKQHVLDAEKTRDKAKKDATKLKAKLLASTKENEKLQSKLSSVDQHILDGAVVTETLQATEDQLSRSSESSSILETDTEKQLADVREQNRRLQEEKQELEQQLSTMFDKPSAGESVNKKLQARLQKLEKQHKKLQDDHEAMKKTRAVTSSDYDSQELQKENRNLKAEMSRINEWSEMEILEVKEQAQNLEKTVTDLRERLKAEEDSKTSMSGNLEDLKAQYKEQSQHLDSTKQTLETVLIECESSKVKLAALLASNDELSDQNERLKKELKKHSVSGEAVSEKLTKHGDVAVDSSVLTNSVPVGEASQESKEKDAESVNVQSSSDQVVGGDYVPKELYEQTLAELHDLQSEHETVSDENRGLLYEVERLETELADVRFELESDTKSNGVGEGSVEGVSSDAGCVTDVQTIEPSGQPVSLDHPSTQPIDHPPSQPVSFGQSPSHPSAFRVVPSQPSVVRASDSVRHIEPQLVQPIVQPIPIPAPLTSTPMGKKSRGRGKVRESLAPRIGVKLPESSPSPTATKTKRQTPQSASPKPPQRSQPSKESELKKQIDKLQKENRSLGQKAEAVGKLETDLAKVQKENRGLAQRAEGMAKLEVEFTKLKKRLESLAKEKRELQARLDREASHHGSSASLGSTTGKGKKEKGKKGHEKEIAELRQQLERKEREKDELLNIIHRSGQGEQAPTDISELRMQFEILLAEKKNMISRFEAEKAKLNEDLEELKERNELLEKEKSEMVEQDIENLTTNSGDVNRERMAQHLEKLSAELNESHQEQQQLAAKCEQLSKEKIDSARQLMNDMIQLQQRVTDLTAKTEVLERERDALRSENRTVGEEQERCAELEARLRTVEEERSRLQRELEERSQQAMEPPQSPEQDVGSRSRSASLQQQQQTPEQALPRNRSSSSLLSVSIPSPGSTRSQSPSMSILSQSELSIQNELLMVEKRQLCAKIEESERKTKELQGTVRQLGLQTQKLQQEMDQTHQEADSERIQIQLIMDEKKDLCQKLEAEKAKVKNLKVKIATMSKQVVSLEQKLHRGDDDDDGDALSSLQEQKAILEMQLEKAEQDLEILQKERTETSTQYETSLAETHEKISALELQIAKEKAKTKAAKEELEDMSFRYEELRIQTQRSSSSDTSPREAKDARKELREMLEESTSETSSKEETKTTDSATEELKLQILKLEADVLNLKQPYDLLVQSHSELSNKYEDIVRGQSKLQNELSEAQRSCKQLQDELDETKKTLQDISHESDMLKLNATEKDKQMLAENKRLKEALEDCVTTRAKLREQVQELEDELKKLKMRHVKDSEEMEKLVDQLDEKEDELEQKDMEIVALKEQIEDNGGYSGGHRNSVIEVTQFDVQNNNKILPDKCTELETTLQAEVPMAETEQAMEGSQDQMKYSVCEMQECVETIRALEEKCQILEKTEAVSETLRCELMEKWKRQSEKLKEKERELSERQQEVRELEEKLKTIQANPEASEDATKLDPFATSTPIHKNQSTVSHAMQRVGFVQRRCYSATCVSNFMKVSEFLDRTDRTNGKTEDVARTSEADVSMADLQEENNRLYKVKMELEEQVMSREVEKTDLQKTYAEKEQELGKKIDQLEHELHSANSMLETIQSAKDQLEQHMLKQREEFEDKLARLRLDSLEKHVKDCSSRERIVSQISEAEKKVTTLQDKLRALQEEKNLMTLKLSHHARESKLYERHIKDLEREVEVQQAQIRDASGEHRETIQMLAEMRLQQEAIRTLQTGEWNRIDGKLQSIESQISGSVLSTPYSVSLASISRAGSTTSVFADDGRDRTNTAESADDPGYKSNPDQDEREIVGLRREVHEMKEKYEKEIELLQMQLRASLSCSSPDQLLSPGNLEQHLSPSPSPTDQGYHLSTEMLSLKERVLSLQTLNRNLQEENELLQKQIDINSKEMQMLYSQLENCTCMQVDNKANVESLFGNQLAMLQSQNSSLLQRLNEQADYAAQHAELTERHQSLEEKLRQEKDLVRQKTRDKEKAEIELLRERIFLEKQIREYQKLENLMHEKESYERELREKVSELKEMYESSRSDMTDSGIIGSPATTDSNSSIKSCELSDATTQTTISETTIGRTTQRMEFVGLEQSDSATTDSATALRQEEGKVYGEIRRKMRYRDVRTQVGESAFSDPTTATLGTEYSTAASENSSALPSSTARAPSSGMSVRSGKWSLLTCGCLADIETMKVFSQCKYHQAINRLRRDLKKQDSRRRGALNAYR